MSSASWTLLPETLVFNDNKIDAGSPQPAPIVNTSLVNLDFLGSGVVRPLRRDKKKDFVKASGDDLVKASIGQVLGTRAASHKASGEIPWRTEFGSLIHTLRFDTDVVTLQLAGVYVRDATKTWEPRANITSVTGERDDGIVYVYITYEISPNNLEGNNVAQTSGTITMSTNDDGSNLQINYSVG